MNLPSKTRIWDLPTRLFHWCLAAAVIGLVVTGRTGGDQLMAWHFRLGYLVLALLLFRIVWGLVGGHWSRFTRFLPSPARAWRYLRGQHDPLHAGHNPVGAWSVYAMLLVLLAQAGTGLLVNDENFGLSGPLTNFVSNAKVELATYWHTVWGQWLVIGLVALHLVAVLFYVLVRRHTLIRPMLHGDRAAPAGTAASRDGWVSRLAALAVFCVCLGVVWWISTRGG